MFCIPITYSNCSFPALNALIKSDIYHFFLPCLQLVFANAQIWVSFFPRFYIGQYVSVIKDSWKGILPKIPLNLRMALATRTSVSLCSTIKLYFSHTFNTVISNAFADTRLALQNKRTHSNYFLLKITSKNTISKYYFCDRQQQEPQYACIRQIKNIELCSYSE